MGNAFLFALPLLFGTLFCLWYIRTAGSDVVYSDYIRLIDAYLPDVANPDKFLVADVFTRIPAAFLQRLLNVKLFGFSVTFDRLCAVFGLFLCGMVLLHYALRMRLSFFWYLALSLLLFSLNKWEILLNGTAWAHVVSFGLFFLNYEILDLVYRGSRKRLHLTLLLLLPFIILMFAGEYIAAYAVIMLSAYGFLMLSFFVNKKKRSRSANSLNPLCSELPEAASHPKAKNTGTVRLYGAAFFVTLGVLLIYLLSRHFAVWEHSGSTNLSFFEAMAQAPLFLPRFFVKSFAGAVIGQETIASFFGNGLPLSDTAVLFVGLFVILGYLFAIYLYLKNRMYEETLFPIILLLSGGFNHVLVTLSRWIFLKESYALSSRYSGQFMIGLIGMFLIFALSFQNHTSRISEICAKKKNKTASIQIKTIVMLFTVFILLGNCYTTYQEIQKAPYREEAYEKKADALLHYEGYSEEALCEIMEWTKDPAVLYHAIRILEENRLNVFRSKP